MIINNKMLYFAMQQIKASFNAEANQKLKDYWNLLEAAVKELHQLQT